MMSLFIDNQYSKNGRLSFTLLLHLNLFILTLFIEDRLITHTANHISLTAQAVEAILAFPLDSLRGELGKQCVLNTFRCVPVEY